MNKNKDGKTNEATKEQSEMQREEMGAGWLSK